MPNPIDRPSLNKSLVDRYSEQRTGGAFDAKSIETSEGSHVPVDPTHGSLEGKITKPGFVIKMKQGQSEFVEVADGVNSKETSLYIKGFSNKKYQR